MADLKTFVDGLVERVLAMPRMDQQTLEQRASESFGQATGLVGGVARIPGALTKAEGRFFSGLHPEDWRELKEFAPSVSFDAGKFAIAPEHVRGLSEYLDDVIRLGRGEGLGALPPSFYSGEFAKRFLPK